VPFSESLRHVTILPQKDARTAKQAKTLAGLLLILVFAVFSPGLRLGVTASTARSVRLGTAELTVPGGWVLSGTSPRITVTKPCITIFCATPRAGLVVEVSKLPAKLDEVWANAAKKALHNIFSAEVALRAFQEISGPLQCAETDSLTTDGKLMAACLDSNLRLTSTFRGEASLRPVFYQILAGAHRVE
jgi:hypothetical protein